MSLRVVPCTIGEARAFVERAHSHLHAPISALCAVGVAIEGGELVCVAMLSRPVSRELQAQGCAEVTRCASDGTPHAASMAYGAISRAGIALGWRRLVSSTLLGEAGTCLRAAGWRPVAMRGPRSLAEWSSARRDRQDAAQPGAKVRWEFGPDALPLNREVDEVLRASVGKVALPARPERDPLFATRAPIEIEGAYEGRP